MSDADYQLRRATIEDRPGLGTLWQSMQFPVEELEKRLTEFQVLEDPERQIIGAVGVQIVNRQALIHSEAFLDFAAADDLRERLWQRLQSLAANHGLVRFWTLETAPFWSRSGLTPADAKSLEKLPAAWHKPGAQWLTLKLREDVEEIMSADKEFALFMQNEREKSRQLMDQAKMLKLLATLLAVALFLVVIGLGAYLIMRQRGVGP